MEMEMGMEMEKGRVSGDGGGKSEVVVYRIRQQKKLLTTVVMMSAKTKAFYGDEVDVRFPVLFVVVRVHPLLVSGPHRLHLRRRYPHCPHPDLHRFPHHHQPPY